MKLLNKSILYISIILFFVIGIWSIIFGISVHYEIKEAVDEGLENYKRQIIFQAKKDSTILQQSSFNKSFFEIKPISKEQAISFKDVLKDTVMFMQDSDDITKEIEPVRILSTAFLLNDSYFQLKVINSMVEEDDLIEELIINSIILYFTLLISIILINQFALKKLWNPFYLLLKQIRDYKINKSHNIPNIKTNTTEFIDLNLTINALLKDNLDTFNQQATFIENASHEIQTPLAITQNKLELILDDNTLNEEQATKIMEVIKVIERSINLNKSLLLLTKIENKNYKNNIATNFNKLIKSLVEDLNDLIQYKNISINVQESDTLIKEFDPELANVLISNLLKNAIQHQSKNDVIEIIIRSNEIEMSNQGDNIPLNTQYVYQRFQKSNNSKGTGLGLAIVKSICTYYELDLNYHFIANRHIFIIKF